MAGAAFAMGNCGGCGLLTTFDPEEGPSVLIDPTTNLPPDIGGTDPSLARREPLCEPCVALVRKVRRGRGEPDPWPRWRGLDVQQSGGRS